jgi:hypothetical protein
MKQEGLTPKKLYEADVPATGRVLAAKLKAVLSGERDPALADDPELYYQDAVGLRLLLNALAEA